MTRTKLLIGQILVVFAIVIAGVWAATQWAAAMLGYQPRLGLPWILVAGWPVYRPWQLFPWWYWYDAYAPAVFGKAGAFAAASGFMGCGAAIIGSLWRVRQTRLVTTYGSSRWATRREVEQAGLLRPAGVFLGRLTDRYLRHDGPEHVMAFAPTRSGKGVGLVVPTLLSWTGSAVIHDIKGENWQLTAGWRQKFASIDEGQLDGLRHVLDEAIARPFDDDSSRTQDHRRHARNFAHPACGDNQFVPGEFRPAIGLGKQALAVFDGPVLGSTNDEIDFLRPTHEQRIDVTFPISDNDQLRGFGGAVRGGQRTIEPSLRFLVLVPSFAALLAGRTVIVQRSRPDLRIEEAENRLVVCVHGNHRMDEEARSDVIPATPQTSPLPVSVPEIDLGGVLCRDDAASTAPFSGLSAKGFDDFINGDRWRTQETMCRQFPGTTATDLSHYQKTGGDDPLIQPCTTLGPPRIAKHPNRVKVNHRPPLSKGRWCN